MTKSLFTQHLSISITTDMDRLLEELARTRTRQSQNKPVSKAQLIREAIRLYLDQQADLYGSRKQIAKSMEGKLALLTNEIAGLTHKVELLTQQAIPHESPGSMAKAVGSELALLTNAIAVLDHEIYLLNEQAKSQQQTLERFHAALQPLLTWVETRRIQLSK